MKFRMQISGCVTILHISLEHIKKTHEQLLLQLIWSIEHQLDVITIAF
jgi:hypothetical protein